MAWTRDLQTYLWVFPVGRGNAAFLRTPLNQGFVLDAGEGDDCDPLGLVSKHFLGKLDAYGTDPKKKNAIAQAVLSHPHADHISQCARLKAGALYPALLTCPHSKESSEAPDERVDWDRFEESDLLEDYKSLWESRSLPLQTIRFDSQRSVPNLEYGIFYVRPPVCDELHKDDDNKYGNATSIVLYYRHGSHSVLVPGDVTPEAMATILSDGKQVEKRFTRFSREETEAHPTWHSKTSDQPSLRELLKKGLTVLIAPHHGLESCYSTDLYAAIGGGKPDLVVISERRKAHEGDGSTDARYQSDAGANGLNVTIDGKSTLCRSVTTKAGRHILVRFSGTGTADAWANASENELLSIVSP